MASARTEAKSHSVESLRTEVHSSTVWRASSVYDLGDNNRKNPQIDEAATLKKKENVRAEKNLQEPHEVLYEDSIKRGAPVVRQKFTELGGVADKGIAGDPKLDTFHLFVGSG